MANDGTAQPIDPVVGVSARTTVVELDAPVRVGASLLHSRSYALVTVETASGAVGHAYALSRDLPIAEIADDVAEHYLIGRDADCVVDAYQAMYRGTRAGGRSGAVAKSIGLLDIALWDAKARRLGLPLWRLLGGGRPTNPAMIVAAYPDPSRDVMDLVEQVTAYTRQGFRIVKIARDPDVDRMAQWLEGLALSLPAGAKVVVDCGWAYDGPHEACAELAQWERTRLAWIEDPLVPEDTAGYRRLHECLGVPIGAGDEMGDAHALRQLVITQAVDVLRVDIACLGVTGARDLVAVAGAAGVPVSYHVYPEVSAHLAAARSDGAIVESFDPAGNPYDATHRIISGGSAIAHGWVTATESPGLGFMFRENP